METNLVVWEAKRDNILGTQQSMAFVAMRAILILQTGRMDW